MAYQNRSCFPDLNWVGRWVCLLGVCFFLGVIVDCQTTSTASSTTVTSSSTVSNTPGSGNSTVVSSTTVPNNSTVGNTTGSSNSTVATTTGSSNSTVGNTTVANNATGSNATQSPGQHAVALGDQEALARMPFAKMPFVLYYNVSKACKQMHQLPFMLDEQQVEQLWNCTFDPWFQVVGQCERLYYNKFPDMKPNSTSKRGGEAEAQILLDISSEGHRALQDQDTMISNQGSFWIVGNNEVTFGSRSMDIEPIELRYRRTADSFGHLNFSTVWPRVPRAVLDCALNRSGYMPSSSERLPFPIVLNLIILAWTGFSFARAK